MGADYRAAGKLSAKYTVLQLAEMERAASAAGRRDRAETLRWAIYYRQRDERAAAGNPVSGEGYSGRQSKRRR